MNSKHQNVEMEELRENKDYAFTLSPSDTKMSHANVKRNIALYQWWQRIRNTLEETMRYSVLTELRVELSKLGRPHLHAKIKVTNKLLFYMHDTDALEHIGMYCIRPIGDIEDLQRHKRKYMSWDEYLSKQDDLMKPYFNKYSPFEYPFTLDFTTKIIPLSGNHQKIDPIEDAPKFEYKLSNNIVCN